jgi:hypothetical protein
MERRNYANGELDDMASGTFGYRIGDGAPGAVKIEGLSAVQRDLRGMGKDLDLVKGEFLATNRKVAEIVIEGSKKFVPVLSGALANSIRDASTKKSAKIRVGSRGGGKRYGASSAGDVVEYAGPIHFGWPARRIKPQPFIYEATDQRRSEIAMKYAERITSIRNRYDL